MLSIEPATARRRHTQHRAGLALAGGGPLGAFYELGALHALQEATEGLDLTQLHGYVGVSSGAIIAASLANGISTTQLGRLFTGEAGCEFPMAPGVVMRPAVEEYARCLARLPSLFVESLRRLALGTADRNWTDSLTPLLRALPVGLFDNQPFEAYLRREFSSAGRTNDFRKLKHPLRVVAADLNTSKEVRFGEPGLERVTISRAIQASTALPGLYTPVKIGGRTYVDGALLRTMHASVVLDMGADLIISVNPLVPFSATRASRKHRDLVDGGLSVVVSQMFRALIQSRMQIGMARYGERYPHSDRLLLEPDRDDEAMFFVNVFSYSGRRRLLNHAYQRTREELRENAHQLAPVLARHGIALRTERLRESRRTFLTSIGSEVPEHWTAARHLEVALDRLSGLLEEFAAS